MNVSKKRTLSPSTPPNSEIDALKKPKRSATTDDLDSLRNTIEITELKLHEVPETRGKDNTPSTPSGHPISPNECNHCRNEDTHPP